MTQQCIRKGFLFLLKNVKEIMCTQTCGVSRVHYNSIKYSHDVIKPPALQIYRYNEVKLTTHIVCNSSNIL